MFNRMAHKWTLFFLIIGGIALYACSSDTFPVGEEFTEGFEVPFVNTFVFNFKTGSGDITGVQSNLQIISGADVQNLISAAPGGLQQSEELGVISGAVFNRFGSPVRHVAMGGTDAAGNVFKDPEGNIVMGVTDIEGNIVAPILFNSITGAPEFINTEGTGENGGFTVFNAPVGELFFKAVRGGRGNGRITAFPGSVSLTPIDVFPVAIPVVGVSGVVRTLDETTRVGQAEIFALGLSGKLITQSSGIYAGAGFGSESRFLLKVSAADHHDTYQEVSTDLTQLQVGTATPDITQDLNIASFQEVRSLAEEAGIMLDPGKGILMGAIVEQGTRKNNAMVRATDRSGGAIGTVVYFDAETNRPNPGLTKTSTNGRYLILNLPPGEAFLTVHATVASATGVDIKSAGSVTVPVFANALSLKEIFVQSIRQIGSDEPHFTVALSGIVTEEDRITTVQMAGVTLLGVPSPLPGNPGPTPGDGSYDIQRAVDKNDIVPLLAHSRFIARVEAAAGHRVTYQTVRTGRQDIVRNLVAVSTGLFTMEAGTGAILGKVINGRPGGPVDNIVIEATRMIDGESRAVSDGTPVGAVHYLRGEIIDPNLASTSSNGRFLISNLPPGLIMIKATSSDDSGNLLIQSFQDGVTLADITVNHVPVTAPVSGQITDLHNLPIDGVAVSVLGEKGSFSSGEFANGVPLAVNSQFLLKAEKADFIETYNFHLKTNLTDRVAQQLFITAKTEISDFANQGGVQLDQAKGMIAGEVVETSLSPDLVGPISVGMAPKAIVVGFFDEDNLIDLAVAHAPNLVSILLGQKDGGFDGTTIPPILVGTDPSSMAVNDFDRDGRLDLAVANRGSNTVSIHFGLGNGQFASRFGPISDGIGLAPRSITTDDFDRDGILDLAVANEDSNTLSVLLGDGNGNFSSQGSPCENPCPVGTAPRAVTSADFDGDSLLDQAVADFGSDSVTLLLSRSTTTNLSLGEGSQPGALALEDFNGDGILDLVVVNTGIDTVSSFRGDGRGGFEKVDCLPENDGINDCPLEKGSKPVAMTLFDFDQDGRLDLALGNEGSKNISLLLGNGDGGFILSSKTFLVGQAPISLVSGDFNLDGQSDLGVITAGSGSLSVLLSFSAPVEGVVIEARDEHGDSIGAIRYLNENLNDVADNGQLLDRTSKSGRFIIFNVPVGFTLLRAVPQASDRVVVGNALVTVFGPERLSFTKVPVNPQLPLTVEAIGVSCRPLGDTCTKVGNVGISFFGYNNTEICVSNPDCVSSRLDASYTVALDAHSQFVSKLIGPDVALPGDSDGDGVSDARDNCPNIFNPDQIDANGNRIGDACELFIEDDDGDGILNEEDNCPFTPNLDQLDSDGDGIGDVCGGPDPLG